jgi:hypothetical protein
MTTTSSKASSKKRTSSPVPHEVCEECGKLRPVHQREPRVLCKNCYMQLNPPQRQRDICRGCNRYVPIVGHGMCRRCYQSWYRSQS